MLKIKNMIFKKSFKGNALCEWLKLIPEVIDFQIKY